MNCPAHCVLFGSDAHSYRDLPIRIADFGRLHRYELSGVATGLTRVRSFSQDDAHIFCTPEQIEAEVTAFSHSCSRSTSSFGFGDVRIFLSTRPEKAIGDDALWDHAERVLAALPRSRGRRLHRRRRRRRLLRAEDRLRRAGRPRPRAAAGDDPARLQTCPSASTCTTSTADGTEQRPVMIHRAMLGSLERFFGVMLEHFAGDLPPWLAPEQVRVLSITDAVVGYAETVAGRADARAASGPSVDERKEKLGYKIRDGETMKIPYLLVVGQREAEKLARWRCGCATVVTRACTPSSRVLDRIESAVKTRSSQL